MILVCPMDNDNYRSYQSIVKVKTNTDMMVNQILPIIIIIIDQRLACDG
ncbi:MAG: hypothetical protein JWQ30_1912 [Sediminibacterium sp.]|nr:hypothetical protein [Sediminibacterium sp.]